MKAKVAYTYKWTDAYIEAMPFIVFMDYWKAITPLEAEQQLLQFESTSIPHMKDASRKEAVQKYKKSIRSMIDRTQGKVASIQDLAKAFAGMIDGQ